MTDTPPPAPSGGTEPDPPPQATLLQVVGAVFWSFFGVRKGEAMRQDGVTIRPHQVIIVGIVLAAVLVFSLIALVRVILRSAAG